MIVPSLVPLKFLTGLFALQASKPFFADDFQGWMKVLGVFGGMLAVFTGVVVKWGQSSFSKRLEKIEKDIEGIQHDLDGVGANLNSVRGECTTSATKHDEIRTRVDRKEVVIDNVLRDQGSLDASVSSLEKLVHGLQGSIIVAINDQLANRDKDITAIKVDIGKLQESMRAREDTRTIIREILNVRGKDSA